MLHCPLRTPQLTLHLQYGDQLVEQPIIGLSFFDPLHFEVVLPPLLSAMPPTLQSLDPADVRQWTRLETVRTEIFLEGQPGPEMECPSCFCVWLPPTMKAMRFRSRAWSTRAAPRYAGDTTRLEDEARRWVTTVVDEVEALFDQLPGAKVILEVIKDSQRLAVEKVMMELGGGSSVSVELVVDRGQGAR